ncbi:DegT/DnrJ/EryC1/StrS family aminotransferase [Bacillus paranthracis]
MSILCSSFTVPPQSAYHTYIIQVENRNELLLALNQADIYRGVHYRDNTQYSMYVYGQNTCPHAHKISEQVISLPLHLYLSQKRYRLCM